MPKLRRSQNEPNPPGGNSFPPGRNTLLIGQTGRAVGRPRDMSRSLGIPGTLRGSRRLSANPPHSRSTRRTLHARDALSADLGDSPWMAAYSPSIRRTLRFLLALCAREPACPESAPDLRRVRQPRGEWARFSESGCRDRRVPEVFREYRRSSESAGDPRRASQPRGEHAILAASRRVAALRACPTRNRGITCLGDEPGRPKREAPAIMVIDLFSITDRNIREIQ